MQPETYARALLERLAVTDVPDIHAVAAALGVPVHEKPLQQCDGMLVRVKGTAKGIIAVKSSMREASRKLFTVAHELGHLLLPGHDDYGICSPGAIETWAKDLKTREREANVFAAELLMPLTLVKRMVGTMPPSFDAIERVAGAFQTSLTSSGYRLAETTQHAVAVVWSQGGRVRWAKRSVEFMQWPRVRDAVDARTFAADLFLGKEVPEGLHPVPADAWLDEFAGTEETLLEESRHFPAYGAVLTLLWAKSTLGGSDHAEDLLDPLDPDEFSIHRTRWPAKRGSGK